MTPSWKSLGMIVAVLITASPAQSRAPLMAAPSVGELSLAQVTLPSHDLARSVAFYRDRLGLKLLFQVPNAAFFDLGGIRLRLEQNATAAGPGDQLYFEDPGLRKATALKAGGFPFAAPPEIAQKSTTFDLMIQDFEDPDGNLLAFIGKVERDARSQRKRCGPNDQSTRG